MRWVVQENTRSVALPEIWASSSVESPRQRLFSEEVAVRPSNWFTVIVTLSVSTHPNPVVTVTL